MPRCFLGIDVGATKSQALLADETGRLLASARGGPGNPDEVGLDGLARVLQQITRQVLEGAGVSKEAVAGAGFGIAGYDWPSQEEGIRGAIATLSLGAPGILVNDALLGVAAAASRGWGVSVVAGTSCNCWGWDRDRRTGRMTGHSWLGEAAGGHELVLKALQAIAAEWTHRGPATALTGAFVRHTQSRDAADLLERLTTGQLAWHADMAPLVFQVARQGDPLAQELVVWAGRELGSLALGVIRQLDLQDEEFEVVLAGAFFAGSPRLSTALGEVVHAEAPRAVLVRLQAPPAVGGVLLGMQEAGLQISRLRQVMWASLSSHRPE